MDKLAAMQTFIRVVESGAFSRAATLLDLPKSTVTRQIQALEQQLKHYLAAPHLAPFDADRTRPRLLSGRGTMA
ncbi:chromosome replication initiation inhibitor protein [Serratia odorifera]|uniref:Chromosome replication initiation inhibitor protein n=1 Tax=Serratia odorifera TaxID=618 RepID=A0A447KYV4_SEROD|nr:LysR family transcriptional regulator [Serratia odorifera]VDZ63292.1 chromosome replication initiation inhibitor protein [Serratia odorifera]